MLVNNAGVGTDWGTAGADPDFDAIQAALDTNFFGAYRLRWRSSRCCARANTLGW